tara:strand:+ start:1782 stop:3746 length:1965 start_codon:yes stop_codon:yes gene_type:complete
MASNADEIDLVIQKVLAYESSYEPLFKRMDTDFASYWLLQDYKPNRDEGVEQKDAYTTNRPRVLAETVHNAIAMSEVVVRVDNDEAKEGGRKINDNYESWVIGSLTNANNWRLDGGNYPLISEIGFRGITRGHVIAARAMLRKHTTDGEEATYEDITPIDARHLVFERGNGKILWAAIVTRRTRTQIRDEYPDYKFEDTESNDGNQREKVIDYYFTMGGKGKNAGQNLNSVIINKKYARNKVLTHSPRFPIVIRSVGRNPGVSNFSFIQEEGGSTDIPGIAGTGDSIWGPMRHANKSRNRSMTYRTGIMAREVQGVFTMASPGAEKDIEGRVDEPGRVHYLDSEAGEKLELIQLQKLGQDAQIYDAVVAQDELGADLPQAAYGNASVPISGATARMLGRTISNRIDPFLKPLESLLEGCIANLEAQYATGQYKPITVAGRTRQGINFNREIKHTDIKNHGLLKITLKAELPEDRMEKILIATQAVKKDPTTGEALYSYPGARDEILELQSGDKQERLNTVALAKGATPMLALTSQLEAAVDEGNMDVAAFLWSELQKQSRKDAMQEVAMEFAFMDSVNANPIQGAANGLASSGQQLVGPNGQPIASDVGPFDGVDSRAFGSQGQPGTTPVPSEVAGLNGGPIDPSAVGLVPNVI